LAIVLLAALAALVAALAVCAVVVARSGETRVAWLGGALVCLGAVEGLALWSVRERALLLDPSGATALFALAGNLLALLGVLAVGRMLRELERAEALHWDGMEGVRGLTELASRRGVSLLDKLPILLEIGCERLGLEIGMASRVRGERYEVLAIHAPDDHPVAAGAVFGLADTHCQRTLASERPVAIARSADAHWAPHPARAAFRFEAYLATVIRVAGEPFGTLVFGSSEPRVERFTATHKDLLVLMAQWIGSELEREELRERPAAPARPQRGVSRRRDAGARAAAGLDLSRALARLEKRIRRAAGSQVEVLLKPARALPAARALPIPLEQLVLSLVRKAVEAMPEGGRLVVSTAQREPRETAPGMLPTVAPNRYVTLCVRETGGQVDADALSRLFEREPDPGDGDAAAPGLLSLAVLYRMLQRVGGDLSVELEPGRGSTFTVFLPLAETQETQAGVDSAGAPSGPPPLH
jgi:hypothetical protein